MDQGTEHGAEIQEGWYRFESSAKIKKNKIYTFNLLGTSFVCFRDSHNQLHVFHAYCPHLGAHLGLGGKLSNDHIICPFHGWKFKANGECAQIPYCSKIPKRARLQSYPHIETATDLYVYFNNSTSTTLAAEINPLLKYPIKNLIFTNSKQLGLKKFFQLVMAQQISSGLYLFHINQYDFLFSMTPINHKMDVVTIGIIQNQKNNFIIRYSLKKQINTFLKLSQL